MNIQLRPLVFGLSIALLLPQVSFGQQTKQAQTQKSDEIVVSSLGTTKNVHQRGKLFFGGQFTADDLGKIKDQKIARVITLRTDGEVDWNEEATLKAANMECIKVPFRTPETLTDEVFDKVRELLKDKSKPTLLHCGSANRVGGVWIPYRVLDEGVDVKTAVAEAGVIGLRAEFLKEKALDYIKRKQAQAKDNREASMKPGINDRFVDPQLDVSEWLGRFEIESREVYAARQRVLDVLDIKPGMVVADIGAGTGFYSRLFASATGENGWVYAVDISPRFLEHINKQSQDDKVSNISSVLCTDRSVRLAPNSIDVAFICDTYHHFEYPKSTLASIRRALKPGGRLVVIDFERIAGESRKFIIGHVRAGKSVFQQEIVDAGMRFVDEVKIPQFKENYLLRFQKQ